jgi:aspartate kinase
MNRETCKTIVMKFGGASLATPDHIRRAARRVAARRAEGFRPVVVVSAMGRETDRLLSLAAELREGESAPAGRLSEIAELDVALAAGEQVSAGLMALAINLQGVPAQSFLAHQLPLRTDGAFGDARITRIETQALREVLARDEVPVVAGFQGVSDAGRVVTLGRGGSDTTAVALAAALEAVSCEFYKDVDGVHAADPKLDPSAPKLAHISYDRMRALTGNGARILHTQAVALADSLGVRLHVRSAFRDEPGTWITHTVSHQPALGALPA